MLAIAYLDENGQGFCSGKDPWLISCEGMTFYDIEMKIQYLKECGCDEITVFQSDGHRELTTWEYVLNHMVIS